MGGLESMFMGGGGGGLSTSSSAQGGDNRFDNTFNYKTGGAGGANDNTLVIFGLAAVAVVLLLKMGK